MVLETKVPAGTAAQVLRPGPSQAFLEGGVCERWLCHNCEFLDGLHISFLLGAGVKGNSAFIH